ncbi:MAG: LytTR family DNA-binding domain-containing protein [Cyclobacteriaceae bacterium]|nr:LytTR family DNA-binding domain-containing protein [Cyclobacteriaceae bacterium]
MKVLIIEDEKPAAEKLMRLLEKYDQGIEILAMLGSVESSVGWLKTNQENADLVFMDVQLTDGLAFHIFDRVKVVLPVIFITAFDEYALDAFRANGIDYLLKPITFSTLSASLQKMELLKRQLQPVVVDDLHRRLGGLGSKRYKQRFMVKFGDHIRSVPTENVSYFYAEGRDVYLYTAGNSKFIIDFRLEDLEPILDPVHFFRPNRSFVLNIEHISDVLVYSNSRLRVITQPEPAKEIIVSRDRVSDFKEWFDGISRME